MRVPSGEKRGWVSAPPRVSRRAGNEPSTGATHTPLSACSPLLPCGAATQTAHDPSGESETSPGSRWR